ncbi:MAG TPA: indole-3-glycerol phosphate synthase TrpC [Cyclobacteriaceae bacterium]|nr:indole-3-glycerol phosphate synthase TrpC [Cyclobacteriaceae bacterium]
MTILEEILIHKKQEVAMRKVANPISELERSVSFGAPVISMRKHLLQADKSGIIAEIKRKSPSKGIINASISVAAVSTEYVRAGASAISVLTDNHFFGGSNDDLIAVRKLNACPILRKDFVVDEYQIIEAKSLGADAILLSAAALDPGQLKTLCAFAHSLGLEVLLEVHNESELKLNLDAGADLIGVNNRNLKTFELDVNISRTLAEKIPGSVVKVSESGIENPAVIMDLKNYGFRGFLIGQTFMQSGDPGKAAMQFIMELKNLEKGAARKN